MHEVHENDVRRSAVAGLFYPQDPTQLEDALNSLLDNAATIDLKGDIKALVSPHAGYIYSGHVAAVGFKNLSGSTPKIVVVISPSHRDAFSGISVFNGRAYSTPLGEVPIAREYADALIAENEIIRSSWLGHRKEHAVEVQLPFLQRELGEFLLIPVVLGEQSYATCEILGCCLAEVLADVPCLFVASSDLSHYYPYKDASEKDRLTISVLEELDSRRFYDAVQDGAAEACGCGTIITAMIAAKMNGADAVRSLAYGNSGDVTGDHSAVVGYMSAAIYEMSG
jgi:AmmeMemoRadiSam system protein B